jgi:hypothetical protein
MIESCVMRVRVPNSSMLCVLLPRSARPVAVDRPACYGLIFEHFRCRDHRRDHLPHIRSTRIDALLEPL